MRAANLLNRKSKTDSVRTPPFLLKVLESEFGSMHDPVPFNPKWTPSDGDALSTPWRAVNYVNPPYSKTKAFVKKAFEEWQLGKTVVMLIKVHNLSTKYFETYGEGAELRILANHLTFPGYDKPSAFGSVLVIYRAHQNSNM